MKQKRVSFKVAKAIKAAGYPQGQIDYAYFLEDFRTLKAGQITASFSFPNVKKADAPYAIDVWLWLWREKKACISILFDEGNCGIEVWYKQTFLRDFESTFDPEKAIVAAIEYLVDNDLIK